MGRLFLKLYSIIAIASIVFFLGVANLDEEEATVLVYGQVLAGMNPDDPPAPPGPDPKTGEYLDKNNPMIPVVWTRNFTGATG